MHGDVATVLLDDFTNEREPQTGGLLVLVMSFSLDAIELLPNTIDGLGRNSVAAVLHTNSNSFGLERRGHRYRRALRTVSDRIVHQIFDNLRDQAAIGCHGWNAIGRLFDKPNAFLASGCLQR